jgi:hypothetical protein
VVRGRVTSNAPAVLRNGVSVSWRSDSPDREAGRKEDTEFLSFYPPSFLPSFLPFIFPPFLPTFALPSICNDSQEGRLSSHLPIYPGLASTTVDPSSSSTASRLFIWATDYLRTHPAGRRPCDLAPDIGIRMLNGWMDGWINGHQVESGRWMNNVIIKIILRTL